MKLPRWQGFIRDDPSRFRRRVKNVIIFPLAVLIYAASCLVVPPFVALVTLVAMPFYMAARSFIHIKSTWKSVKETWK